MKVDIQNLSWSKEPEEAIAIQRELAGKVILAGDPSDQNLVAGVDCSSYGNTGLMVGAVVVMDVAKNVVVDSATSFIEPDMPYIPGLLGFREIPVLIEAFLKIETIPGVIICDGQGLAHMRKFGIACHLGLYLDIPTVGCGKTSLVGSYHQPDIKQGSTSVLSFKGETVGNVVRTRRGVSPVFVSPGHLADFKSAVKLVLNTCTKYRLPEPIRRAHKLSNETRKELDSDTDVWDK
ncbi:MAG: endonuclease V [Calditrichaeota bacterium]|jgi:deoxyribonuclease V|nr:endonuclease V [Calditrichota bacterium]MBT7617756.1 endonuclease V [Calditrichota bacterium]MBT7789524.1 endonuclease V [Calditrichota bacterium]